MNVSLTGSAARAAKCPTKRTVNLAKKESNKRGILFAVLGILAIAAVCFLVAKFGVIDQYARLNTAERSYNEVHNQLLAMEAELENYPEVEQEYRTYSRKWMTDDSSVAVSVDRTEVLDLMEDYLMSCGTVNTFTVSESTVLVTMSGMNLKQISLMLAELQRQPIVSSTALTIASTAREEDELLDFSITVILQPAEEVSES